MKRLVMTLASIITASSVWAARPDTLHVAIPLSDGYIARHETIRIKDLIRQRTGLEPSYFQLKAVVLHARARRNAFAQIKAGGKYSSPIRIPPGHRGELYRVRVPAPHDVHRGPWRLGISGAVYVDKSTAILEPKSAAYLRVHPHWPHGYDARLNGRHLWYDRRLDGRRCWDRRRIRGGSRFVPSAKTWTVAMVASP